MTDENKQINTDSPPIHEAEREMGGGVRILFIDRDGTLIKEMPPTYQIDSFEKVIFYPHVFQYMRRIATELNYELVLVSNQDGMGTPAFPYESFIGPHKLVMTSFANEGIHFSKELIDTHWPDEHSPNRKPGIGMFTDYLNNSVYDIANSYVIGDRITDIQLAKNLGCKGIWLNNDPNLGGGDTEMDVNDLRNHTIALETQEWQRIYDFLKLGLRRVKHERNTSETK